MATSAEIAAASHLSQSTVEVYAANGDPLQTLPFVGGSVTAQYGSPVRRTCAVAVADDTLIPRTAGDLLHPLSGHTLRVTRQPVTLMGVPDLGRFVITDAAVKRGKDGTTVDLTGQDYSEIVAGAGYPVPAQILPGVASTVVGAFLASKMPTIVLDLSAATATVPLQSFGAGGSGDPWQDARNVMADVGYDLFFDVNGTATARATPVPGLLATPIASYGPNAIRAITAIERPLTRAGVVTGVIVVSTNPLNGTIFVSELYDVNPASPTYSLGPLGQRPYFHTSSVVGSQAACDALAVTELAKRTGQGDSFTIGMIPNPALDVGDVITVQFDAASAPIDVIIESLTMPLAVADEMRLTCRTSLAAA